MTADTLAYFSYSEGFKSGGFNNYAATAAYRTYDPEKLDTYEVGVKNELLERRLRLNLAAFYSNYKDAQLAVLANTPEGLVIATQNAGKSRIYGAEGEATVRVTAHFTLDGSFGYLKNKYLSLTQGAIDAQVKYGDSLIQAPVWTTNAGAQYELPLAEGASLTYRADLSYKDRFYYFAANQPRDVQSPFALVNMRMTYDSGSRWTAAVFVNNLLNRYYYALREDIRYVYDDALDWPAPPRVVGIDLNFKF